MPSPFPRTLALFATLLALLQPRPAAAQCPSPTVYEIGGGSYAAIESTTNVQAISRGRTVQLVQTSGIPALQGSYTLDHTVVAMHEEFVGLIWAIDSNTLYGLDAINPAAVLLRGRLTLTPSEALQTVRVRGSYVYATSHQALYIVDVSNPAAPVLRSRFVRPNTLINDAEVVGSYAYLAIEATPYAALLPVDISNPTAPVGGNPVTAARIGYRLGRGFGNPYLYLLSGDASLFNQGRIERYNISVPSAPSLAAVSSAQSVDFTTGLRIANNNAVCILRFPGFTLSQVELYDTVSLAPLGVSSYLDDGAGMALEMPNYLYISKVGGGMDRIGISNPSAPTTNLNFVDTPPGFVDTISTTNSGYAVMCGRDDAWFFAVPASGSPAPMLHLAGDYTQYYYHVASKDNYAVVLRYNSLGPFKTTILLYQASLAGATLVGSFNVTPRVEGIDFGSESPSARRLYITANTGGFPTLYVVDITNPASISITGTFALAPGVLDQLKFLQGSPLLGLPPRVLVSGTSGNKTQIISVASAVAPAALGVIPFGSDANTITATGGTTIWLTRFSELRSYDISTPAVPVQLGSTVMPGFASSVAIISPFGALLGVTCEGGKFVTVESGNPSAPTIRQIATIGADALAFAYDGNRLHVADGRDGYKVLSLPDFSAPPALNPNSLLANAAICPGTNLTLAASFVAIPAVSSHQWFRNGIPLSNGPTGLGSTISGATTATLTVTAPLPSDAGAYRCDATNTCGTASATAVVTGCYPNCDCSTASPVLNVNDFSCFLNKFAAGDPYANCDGSILPPILNVNDFSCFLNKYAGGCP